MNINVYFAETFESEDLRLKHLSKERVPRFDMSITQIITVKRVIKTTY